MAWVQPKYKREQVNRAGRSLACAASLEEDPSDESLEIISNWRSCHSWPLNTFKLWLLYKARQTDSHSLVAQRLKRLSSDCG
jgi:putative GTP pyrophosphokinase